MNVYKHFFLLQCISILCRYVDTPPLHDSTLSLLMGGLTSLDFDEPAMTDEVQQEMFLYPPPPFKLGHNSTQFYTIFMQILYHSLSLVSNIFGGCRTPPFFLRQYPCIAPKP